MKTCPKPGHGARYIVKRTDGRTSDRCHECLKEANRKAAAKRLEARRNECLDAYGAVCVCCGETHRRFLTFDHRDNDGAEHRQTLGGKAPGTMALYKWIKDNGFPEMIQILCYNCNFGRARNGGVCPHKETIPA